MNATVFPTVPNTPPPPPYAQVTVTGGQRKDALVTAVRDAFQDAMALRGRLREDAFKVNGFSGRKFRMLVNNLMNEVPDARYMEIGLFHGASFCSALFKNKLRAVGIDNWTEYGGKRQLFEENLSLFKSELTDVEIIEKDFRKVDYANIGKFNVLFYDGSHSEKDQYDGIKIPQPAMDDSYVMIVDDWNWDRVRSGTFNALRDSHVNIDYSVEVRTTFNGELPLMRGANSEWHNGTIVAVVSKNAQ
jgi:hypothetical protein